MGSITNLLPNLTVNNLKKRLTFAKVMSKRGACFFDSQCKFMKTKENRKHYLFLGNVKEESLNDQMQKKLRTKIL